MQIYILPFIFLTEDENLNSSNCSLCFRLWYDACAKDDFFCAKQLWMDLTFNTLQDPTDTYSKAALFLN